MEPPPVQYVTTSDGYNIAYGISGTGRTLIRLPVLWNHFSAQWHPGLLRPEFESLAARFRLVQYDHRGQGLSTRGLPETLSVEDYKHDLEAVIAKVGAPRVILLGTSFPSHIAITYAVDHPQRVDALILRDYTDKALQGRRSSTMQDLAAIDWEHFLDTTARVGFPTKNPDLVKQVFLQSMTQSDHVLQGRVLQGHSVETRLAEIKVPTLILASRAGTPTRSGNEEGGRFLASRIPGARLVLLDGPGAMSDAEPGHDPPAMAAIDDFISSLPLPPSHNLPNHLTGREAEVLRLVASGKSNQQIADELGISISTVLHHVTNILTKTEASNRTEAAAFAHRNGIVRT